MEKHLQEVVSRLDQVFASGEALLPEEEATLLALIAERVAELLEQKPDYLMSFLYRLDVLEEKIAPVMRGQSAEPVPMALARLIWERQKQRMRTKRSVRSRPMNDPEEWAW